MGVSTYPVDGSVSTASLGNTSVTTAKIAADAVTATEIATNAVDTAEIAANAVGLTEMAGLARGSIIYGNASGDPAALTKGTADQVLKSDGTDIAWGSDEGLPTQTSNEGKALITDGTNASWFPRTNHNFLMNGDFQVAQRGTSFTPSSSSGSSLMYTLDRYYGYRSAGTNASIMQQIEGSAPDGFQYHARMGRVDNTTASGYFIIGQQIETKNACALAGQTVCLSMWVKKHANFSGDFGIYVTTGTGTDQAAWDSIGGGWTGGASAYSSTTVFSDLTTSWVRRSVTFTVAAGTKEIAVKMHFSSFVGAAVTNDYVEVTGMQLELGTTPSQFDHKTYGQEMAACQRYYYEADTGFAAYSTNAVIGRNHPVQMRASPTMTWFYAGQGGTAWKVYNILNAAQNTMSASNNIFMSVDGLKWWYNLDGAYAGWSGNGTHPAGISTYIKMDAEL